MSVIKTRKNRQHFELLRVGADVEMFLRNKASGAHVPCIEVVGGTKQHPLPLPGLPEGFARQEDNVMLEFNIAPASTGPELRANIGLALHSITGLLDQKGLAYHIVPSMRFHPTQLDHPQAKTFGCEPDFNVWDRCVNEFGEIPEESKTLRTAGGHVHVSFLLDGKVPQFPDDVESMENVIMALDMFLGVPFTAADRDLERRKLYGKAGAFRAKPYGIEYRVLSNYWITSPARTEFVFHQVEKAFSYINQFEPKDCNAQLRQYRSYVVTGINDDHAANRSWVMRNFGVGTVPNA